MCKRIYSSNQNSTSTIEKQNRNKNHKGFTLIEILIVIGLIAILAAVALVAINPGRQFALARNTQRLSNVTTIANAISQNAADNKGVFTCAAGAIPTSPTEMSSSAGGYNIRDCLVPNYIAEIPVDPSSGIFTSATDYATGYKISQDATTLRITIAAPQAELAQVINAIH